MNKIEELALKVAQQRYVEQHSGTGEGINFSNYAEFAKEFLAELAKQSEPVAVADGTFNHNCELGTLLYAAPPAPVVPDGFMLVPTTATAEMIAAAEEVEDLYRRGTPDTWAKVFRAMIAAAPEPTKS